VTTETRWWLVRHAPVPGMKGRLYGSEDVACDCSDTDAFKGLAAKLPADAVWVASHLSRTHLTAAAIRAQGLDAPEPLVEPDIREQDFGEWAKLTWQEMETREPDVYAEFWKAPARNAPPGGESFADVVARTARVLDAYTAEHAGRDIVAVCHGGSIRAAIAHAMGLTPEAGMAVVVDTLSLTRIDHIEGGLLRGKGCAWRLLGLNNPPKAAAPGGLMR
jgi:alpha-ribazole phosphatase